MIPGAIFSFLVGAVLAFSFRVWILVPVTLLAIVIAMTIELALGASFPTACGYGLFVGIAPQLGYAFGLFARSTLAMRSPLAARTARAARSIGPTEIPTSGAFFAIISLP